MNHYVALFVKRTQQESLLASNCVRAVYVQANDLIEARTKLENVRQDFLAMGWGLDIGGFIAGGIYLLQDEKSIREEFGMVEPKP